MKGQTAPNWTIKLENTKSPPGHRTTSLLLSLQGWSWSWKVVYFQTQRKTRVSRSEDQEESSSNSAVLTMSIQILPNQSLRICQWGNRETRTPRFSLKEYNSSKVRTALNARTIASPSCSSRSTPTRCIESTASCLTMHILRWYWRSILSYCWRDLWSTIFSYLLIAVTRSFIVPPTWNWSIWKSLNMSLSF